MTISTEIVLEPIGHLIELMLAIKYALFCGVFAYEGFKNGVTLTHLGMRKGWVARVYAVFYLLFVLLGFTHDRFSLEEGAGNGVGCAQVCFAFRCAWPSAGAGVHWFGFVLVFDHASCNLFQQEEAVAK